MLVLGALCFAAMGIGVTGLVRSAEGSSAVINAIYLPMAIISGTFFTPKSYPEFLRVIAADPAADALHAADPRRDGARPAPLVGHDGDRGRRSPGASIGLVGAMRGFRWQPVEG